jgi:hypothetical protein
MNDVPVHVVDEGYGHIDREDGYPSQCLSEL